MLGRFRMEEPESVAEVTELLSRFGESAKIYAGGTELLLARKRDWFNTSISSILKASRG